MPPNRDGGRASKACSSCRKQKTRCYDSQSGGACLRCQTLKLSCSLQVSVTSQARRNYERRSPSLDQAATQGHHEKDSPAVNSDRLTKLERVVTDVMRRLEQVEGVRYESNGHVRYQARPTEDEQPPAPVVLLRDVAEEVGGSPTNQRIARPESNPRAKDLIDKNIVSHDRALILISIFQEHYGRWVALDPEDPIDQVLSRLRKSPLLLCASCLIAVRHMDVAMAAVLADPLFVEAKRLISEAVLAVPQGFDFFKAAVILSFWSTTIGTTPLSLDSWLLSGIALQQCIASNFPTPTRHAAGTQTKSGQTLARRCVWNHLCLSHLHYCVGTRRKSSIDRQQIDECRQILTADRVTNFEIRIVAEIELYWIIHEQCYVRNLDLREVQAALRNWREEWAFLFQQPRSTFLQMGLHFAQVLAYNESMKVRSAAVRESLVVEMLQSSSDILDLAMSTADDRTKHLSDHIYHLIAFAAITICRLLHKYDQQLVLSRNIGQFDDMVIRVASWLHSIGPSCHVAHTFGDIVAALHKKLRPDVHMTSPTSSYQDADFSYGADLASLFPDLLFFDTVSGSMADVPSDWLALNQDVGINYDA